MMVQRLPDAADNVAGSAAPNLAPTYDAVPVISIPFFETTTNRSVDIDSLIVELQHDLETNQAPLPNGDRGFFEPFADQQEDPAEWIEKTEGNPPNRASQQPDGAKFGAALTGLVESIVDRFPIAAPTLLTFVGSQTVNHTDATCGQVARALASKKIGKVLLLDSNDRGQLSSQVNLQAVPGTLDFADGPFDWRSCIIRDAYPGIDFCPIGNGRFTRFGSLERLRNAAAEMKQDYQFICVSGGEAHDHIAIAWSSISDGSYLLVSMKNSNQTIAQSAVTELQSCGARLLGCVVTDTD